MKRPLFSIRFERSYCCDAILLKLLNGASTVTLSVRAAAHGGFLHCYLWTASRMYRDMYDTVSWLLWSASSSRLYRDSIKKSPCDTAHKVHFLGSRHY